MSLFSSWWWSYNRAPDGTDVTRTIDEDSTYKVKAADFGFRDPDAGQTFAGVRIDSLPANGRLLLNGVAVTAGQFIAVADIDAGRLVFQPAADASGDGYARFTFSVKDSAGAFDACPNSFCINVCPVNDAPIANDDKASTLANTAVTVNVKANDRDPDNTNAELKVTSAVLADPAKGSVVINADGTLTFKPAAGVTGDVEITYTLKDPGGLSDTATVTISVLPPPGKQCLQFDFNGSTATDGADGNILTYTVSGVSVHVSAFARDDATGAWSKAYVGVYGGGLGVTDSSEGSGANNTHTVDNAGGRDNYLLFEFDQQVVLDKAFLGYVVCDSDLQVWIGNVSGAFDNHITLSDAALASLGFTEVNTTTSSSTRWADLNAGEVAGNVIVIAADTTAQTIRGTTNLIVNGSFEDLGGMANGLYATIPGWTGNGDKVEVGAAATYGVSGATGSRVLELDANRTCTTTGIYQDVATKAGQTYELSLDVAQRFCTAASTNTVEVWWRGSKVATIDPTSTTLTTYRLTVTGSGGNDRLEFREQVGDDDSLGGIIDNVRMVTVTTVGDALDDYFKLQSLKVCTVAADNPPDGTDAVRTIAEDGSYTVLAADFGFRDADAGQTLKAVRIDQLPGNGTLTLNGVAVVAGQVIAVAAIEAGQLRIAPDADENGTPYASFTFSVQDSNNTFDTAPNTFTLNVTPVNDGPVARPDAVTTPEDTPVSGSVLANDSDVENDPLTVTGFSVAGTDYAAGTTATIAGVGTLVINADGSFTFTPAANYTGPVPQATYTITDGAATASSTLDVTITTSNDAPVANPDAVTTPEDTPVSGNVLTNDSDVDSPTLTVTGFSVAGTDYAAGTTAAIAGIGTLVINADGSFTFTPAANYTGPVPQATYTITDGAATASSTLDITVDPVNDAPVANPDAVTTPEDTPVSGNVLTNDSDVDSPTLTVTGFSVAGTDYAAGTTAAIAGVGALVINTDGSFTFTPAANYNGPVPQATYTITDGAATASSTLDITVDPVNDAPVANPDAVTTPEDTPVSGNVLTNDSDVDSPTLTVTGFSVGGTDYAAGTTAAIAGIGTLVINADGSFTFTPAANYNGPVPQANYTLTDGAATASSTLDITVDPVNDAPVANPDAVTTPEDTPVSGNVLTNDSDVDSPTLTVTGFSVGGTDYTAGTTAAIAGIGTLVINADGSFTFEPAANYNGPVPQATYTITDGAATASSTLDVTITTANDAPVANPDAARTPEDTAVSGNVLTNDSDVDSPTLTVTGFSVGGTDYAAGTTATIAGVGTLVINGDGAFTFEPAANYNGPVPQATYTITDGAATASSTLDITVDPVNDAPVANPDTATTLQRQAASGNVIANDTDPDNDSLSVTVFAVDGVNGSFQAGDTATIAGVGSLKLSADGDWTFTPLDSFSGTAPTVTYTISDGAATASSTLKIDVTPVNLPPVGTPDVFVTPEDTSVTGNLLANDTDGDNNPLSVVSFSIAGRADSFTPGSPVLIAGIGTLLIAADGSFSFEPAANFNGDVPQVTYVLSDGQAQASTTLSIGVTPVNDAPTIGTVSATVSEEGLPGGNPDTTGTPDTTDSATASGSLVIGDVDGDPLTVTLQAPTTALTSNGVALTWNGSGTGTLIGLAGDDEIIRISIVNGQYNVQLSGPLDHPLPGVEDSLQFDVGLVVSDGQASALANLQVSVEDDSPLLARVVQSVPPGRTDTNLLLVLDISGSMNLGSGVIDPNTGNELTRLQLELQAIDQLLTKYDELGNVSVRIVTFSTQAQSLVDPVTGIDGWTDVATARNELASIVASGFTNYDEAVNVAQQAFASDGAQPLAQNLVYFLSDGDPTAADTGSIGTPASNPDIGIQPSEEQQWQSFLTDNRAVSFALGVGTDVTQSNLDPLAFDGLTGTNTDARVVTDLSQLSGVLVDTVTTGVLGNLAGGSGSAFGADGGHVRSITVDGSTYVYDPANGGSVSVTGPDAGFFSTGANTLTIETLRGGTLIVDLDDGNYRYTAAASDRPIAEAVQFEFIDNDGDIASGALTLGLNGSTLAGQDGIDVFRWTLADAGTEGAARNSTVSNFSGAGLADGGDVLDLRDLLQGETPATLGNFLDVETTASGTVLHVSSNGDYAGSYDPAKTDFNITLSSVDLRDALALPPAATSADVINTLLNQHKLLVGG